MNQAYFLILAVLIITVFIITEISREMLVSLCDRCSGFIVYKNPFFFSLLSHNHKNYVVIVPDFTISAYQKGGFYDYYRNNSTNATITVKVVPESYYDNDTILNTLKNYGFSVITDTQVTLHPEILKKYSKVIVLHNEYVSQTEFDAIQNSPNVVYLYVNALYAKVSYHAGTITLIKGHGYPKVFNPIKKDWEQGDMSNAFGWAFDMNRFYENNQNCGYDFLKIPNGYESPCFPITAKDFSQVNIWNYLLK